MKGHYGRMGQVGGSETLSSSVPAKIVNQKNYCHIVGETAEMSAAIKNLEDVELVLPSHRHSAHRSGPAKTKSIMGNGCGRALT